MMTLAEGVTASEMWQYGVVLMIVVASVTAVSYGWYWLWLKPLNFRRTLKDVGFKTLSVRGGVGGSTAKDKREAFKRSLRSRKVGHNMRPPYPNGWIVVAESRDVSIVPIHKYRIVRIPSLFL